MNRKTLFTIFLVVVIAIITILLIGLSADAPIADRSGGQSRGPQGGGGRQGGAHQQMNAPRYADTPQRMQQHVQQAPRQAPPSRPPQQTHQAPPARSSHTQQHMPPTQQIRGGTRENPHTSRSPSMSRSVQSAPAPRPHMPPPAQQPRPTHSNGPANRPSSPAVSPHRNIQQGQEQVSRPSRPPGGQQPGQIQQHNIQGRQQTKQFVQQRNAQRNAPSNAPRNFQNNATIPNASSSFQPPTPVNSSILQQQQMLSRQADRTRNTISQRNPGAAQWFSDGFFESHHRHPFYHHQGDNWWWAPSWEGVSTWLPWGWDSAYYYTDSGDAYTVPPQSYQLAPEQYVEPPQDEWMPLGVFAAGQTPAEASYSNMVVQLAVNKSGQLAGTYYNTATNDVHDLDGTVDQYTQEAAWTVSDNQNSPTMTTGLYNLTQDAAIVQVHFPDSSIQTWTLVRLNK